MAINTLKTNRRWGNKIAPTFSKPFKNDEDVKTVTVYADFWVGPHEVGREGYYERITWDEAAGFWARSLDGGEKIFHKRKPSSCSFEPDLQKALLK